MVTCHVCGAQNESANRFCDQCGARLQVEEPVVEQPSPSVNTILTCATCGVEVLPGQAFCENCGTDLMVVPPIRSDQANQPVSTSDMYDAPTIHNEAEFVHASASPTQQSNMEHENYPAKSRPAIVDPNAETVIAPTIDAEMQAEAPVANNHTNAAEAEVDIPTWDDSPTPAGTSVVTHEETIVATRNVQSSLVDEPPSTPEESTSDEAPAAPDPAPVPTAAPAVQIDTAAERQRLEGEIERHQATIAQLEQILAPMPVGIAPDYLTSALDNANQALIQAVADLANLPTGPDPEEVARLEGDIERHRSTIAQLEEMSQTFPDGHVPPYVLTALEMARQELTRSEATLAELYDTADSGALAAESPTSAPPKAPVQPVAPTPTAPPAPEPAAPAEAFSPALPPVPDVFVQPAEVEPSEPVVPDPVPDEPVAPVDATSNAAEPLPLPDDAPFEMPKPSRHTTGLVGPRLLVVESDSEMPLPTDRQDIIVGREDPVSRIFPEVDLTPFGGEAGGVSRQHARISHHGGQWTVTDLNSTNYTHVDGKQITPNVPTPIQDGARVRFGRISTVFKLF